MQKVTCGYDERYIQQNGILDKKLYKRLKS